MSETRILCEGGCGLPRAFCKCSDTQKRMAEIEARLKAATPGPWHAVSQKRLNGEITEIQVQAPQGDWSFPVVLSWPQASDNAELIANAPADIAWLLAEVNRLSSDREVSP